MVGRRCGEGAEEFEARCGFWGALWFLLERTAVFCRARCVFFGALRYFILVRCVFWGATRFLGARRGTPRRYKGRRAIPRPGMNGALPLRRGSGGECWSLAIARHGLPAMPDCRGGVFAVFAKIPPPILSNHMCVSCPPIPISHVCIPCPPIPSAILPIMPAHPASHVCVSCAPILPTMGACRTRPFLSPMCACDARPSCPTICAYHARPSRPPWAHAMRALPPCDCGVPFTPL